MVDQHTDWAELAASYQRRLSSAPLRALARQLGVTLDSLRALDVGWSEADGAFTFPERDASGNVIGILRRFRSGRKMVMGGGRRGLYLPRDWQDGEGVVHVPEGASDVAALLSAGLRAVGRPSCTGGKQLLAELFAATDDDILIVGENDRKEDGRWPGRDGARAVAAALARELGGRVRWTLPPNGYKDIRAYLTREGTHAE
jgi:hypothetical protein